ncbi:hypothetical protein L1987_86811 [Smallanthus sonchifolius]|uniref:Uncharacterized protein n=1 Tax=Smallanthus sonchifolius TaxID=185202 RepID=A0ACB8Y0V5_9ASTR|nr:hypothetical protein L1987_86811 [Smallanthus sonchifolius]
MTCPRKGELQGQLNFICFVACTLRNGHVNKKMRIGLWGGSGQADSAALDGFYKHKGKPYTLLVVNAKTFYILILSGICSFDSTTLRYPSIPFWHM